MSASAIMVVVLCVLCYVVQTFFNKLYAMSYDGPAEAATPVFAAIYGLIVAAATFVYNGFSCHPSVSTLWMGLLNGLALFLFNLSSINASRRGPYAFQSMIMLFGGTLLPLFFSAVFWGDALSTRQVIGIVVMLASFVVINLKGLNLTGRKKGFFLWVGMLFLTNGAYSVLNAAQQRVNMNAQRNEMIIITFLTSGVISLIYLDSKRHNHLAEAVAMKPKTWVYAVGSSIGAAIAINLLMIAISMVPFSSSVLFTITNGSLLVLSVLLSAAVLHEKLEANTIVGVVLACASLVLLCV